MVLCLDDLIMIPHLKGTDHLRVTHIYHLQCEYCRILGSDEMAYGV